MSNHDVHPRSIVAFVDEEGAYDHVLRAALRLASEHGATLILYDSTSASAFSEPVASPVSAEGVDDQFGSRLDPQDLERLGRPTLAGQVEAARADGIDAWGRLASDHGVDALMEYAEGAGAGLLVLPAELDDPGILERLRGETMEKAEEEGRIPIVVVDRDGRLR